LDRSFPLPLDSQLQIYIGVNANQPGLVYHARNGQDPNRKSRYFPAKLAHMVYSDKSGHRRRATKAIYEIRSTNPKSRNYAVNDNALNKKQRNVYSESSSVHARKEKKKRKSTIKKKGTSKVTPQCPSRVVYRTPTTQRPLTSHASTQIPWLAIPVISKLASATQSPSPAMDQDRVVCSVSSRRHSRKKSEDRQRRKKSSREEERLITAWCKE
jgi:hypothetical protein